nr:hypothetical protein [uncultured Sediminibacterium sp.]
MKFLTNFTKNITVVLALLCFISGCKKSETGGVISVSSDEKIRLQQISVKIKEAQLQAKEWYEKAIHNIKSGKYDYLKLVKVQRSDDGGVGGNESLVTDTAFVGLLYSTIYNGLENYDYYVHSMGTTAYNSFVAEAMSANADMSSLFTSYGQFEDPFLENSAAVFANAALVMNNNADFANLDPVSQKAVLEESIGFYFENDPVLSTPPSGIQVSSILSDVTSCLWDAVGGYLIGNARIIRDIVGAINGSSMGYAFIYAMAGKILKQTFVNAGGWFGIAAGFAWCMIF